MKKYFRSALFIWFFCLQYGFAQTTDNVISQSSPDKALVLYIRLHKEADIDYRVVYQKKEILGWSPLGLVFDDACSQQNINKLQHVKKSGHTETIRWLFGENTFMQNNYREVSAECSNSCGFQFTIEARVFNNNLAFRYLLPAKKNTKPLQLLKENTGFHFTRPYIVYRHNAESVINPTPVNELKNNSDFPVVLAAPGMFISINEANNNNYTKAVAGKTDMDNSLAVKFVKDTVKINGAFKSPWRTLSFSNTAIGLCDNSDLLYKLNERPDPAKDYSWIKPGKLIRDMTLTTKGAIDCIDFAKKMNFQYIMFDAGWYGKGYAAEFDQTSDPHNPVTVIDMPGIIRYGKEKNIGLILYVNYVGLRKHNLDTLFTLYKNWGIKGVKFGFVNGLTQDGITWLIKAVKKAQDFGFVIDVHDNYKPTGISRTLPAFLTQEGIRGNENNPDAFHNTTLPFTRFLSGPADYTFCYRNQNDSFNNTLLSKKLQVSQAQQLALTVIFYSPLQSMLWYGRPADYRLPEEIEFFRYVPTTWDKTLHLQGEIGKYITVARRKGTTWFIGTAVAEQPHTTTIKLNFLKTEKTYTAVIYEDDGQGGISKTARLVNSRSTLTMNIAAKAGAAIMISENIE